MWSKGEISGKNEMSLHYSMHGLLGIVYIDYLAQTMSFTTLSQVPTTNLGWSASIPNGQNTQNNTNWYIAWSMQDMHKKRDILTENWESRMVLEKHDFQPENGNVDTYGKYRGLP